MDSDRTCVHCLAGLQQFCETGSVPTYNGKDRYSGKQTFGGYSSHIVVDQAFVLRIPSNLPPAAVAPLLCAGITTYSAMRHWKVGPGQKVGVVGLGGLGHIAVKMAHAMGAHVILFTTSASKVQDGLRLGADEVVLSSDAAMSSYINKLNFIIDTVAADHDVNVYLSLLDLDGTLVQVGAPSKPLPISAFSVIGRRRNFSGSLIGGLPETQEMLDFCSKHNIVADIELISVNEINAAYERMNRNDVKYRFVIDMSSLEGR